MKATRVRVTALATLLALALLAQPAAYAQDGISSDTSGPSGPAANPSGAPVQRQPAADCTFVDFEGLSNNQPVGVVAGTPQVTFGASWLGLIDVDAGGSGNFANEPSPDTITYFLSPADPINFDTGVQFVEVFYVASQSSVPVTLRAWDGLDGTGSEVASAVGNTVGTSTDGAACVGDPTGNFCLWDVIQLSAASNNILSVTLEGATADQFGFDDMTYCTAVPVPTLPGSLYLAALVLALLAAAFWLLRS